MTSAYSDTTMREPDWAAWHEFDIAFNAGKVGGCCTGKGLVNPRRWFVVHRFYLELGWNARKVANLLDEWRFDQQVVLIIAGLIRKRCDVKEAPRLGNKKVDWSLAQELLNEGMTDAEMCEFFKCARGTLEYSVLHAKKPRKKYWPRNCHDC